MRWIGLTWALVACPEVVDEKDPVEQDPVEQGPDATGSWAGSCQQIGGLAMELTDEDGAVSGSIVESTTPGDAMVVDGDRTDAELVLTVSYADSGEELGTLDLTLDGDSLDGEYRYPGDDSGYACTFSR